MGHSEKQYAYCEYLSCVCFTVSSVLCMPLHIYILLIKHPT